VTQQQRTDLYFQYLDRLPEGRRTFERYVTDETLLTWPMLLAVSLYLLNAWIIPSVIVLAHGPLLVAVPMMLLLPITPGGWISCTLFPAVRARVQRRELETTDLLRCLAATYLIVSRWPPGQRRQIQRTLTLATWRTLPLVAATAVSLVCSIGVPIALRQWGAWWPGTVYATLIVSGVLGYVVLGRLYPAMYYRTYIKSCAAPLAGAPREDLLPEPRPHT